MAFGVIGNLESVEPSKFTIAQPFAYLNET
jgi:hypothetical protein